MSSAACSIHVQRAKFFKNPDLTILSAWALNKTRLQIRFHCSMPVGFLLT
jgi:hypothetical protein